MPARGRSASLLWLGPLLYVGWILCPGIPAGLRHLGAALGMALAPAVAGFVLARTGWQRRDIRLGLLGGACLSWFSGTIVWNGLAAWTGDSSLFPSWADAFYLLFLPLTAVAVLNLPDAATQAVGRVRALCDSWISLCGALAFAWPLLLLPVVARSPDVLATLVAGAFGLGDVALIALLVPIVVRAGPVWRPVLLRVGLATICLSLGDVGFAVLLPGHRYTSSSPITAGWVAAFVVLLSVARVWPSGALPVSNEPAVAPGWVRRELPALLGYLPVIAGLGTALIQLLRNQPNPVTGVAILLLIALGSIRQQLVLRENEALTGDLESRVQERTRELARLAYTDLLTGLANRASFAELLTMLNAAGQPPTVVLLDLDGFKGVNDTLGHAAGDELLAAVGQRLHSTCTEARLLARIGGDEFAVVLQAAAASTATALAERLLIALSAPFEIGLGTVTNEVTIAASIGIAGLVGSDGEPRSPEIGSEPGATVDVLRDADLAMYAAKVAGRNRWYIFDPQMRRAAEDRKALEDDLRGALCADQLSVVYQPVVHLGSGAIVGAEALLRWHHPVRGLVGPEQFIPVAEETGLIGAIGAWVLEQACRQTAFWKARLPADADFGCGINLSVHQLEPGLVGLVERVLHETGLAPAALVLEVTEGVFMDEGRTDAETLQQLRRLGPKIYLDDFGTGYSSLGYLRRFPVDGLKIDRSFVAPLSGEGEEAIPTAILSLAQSLALHVVAEGIEEPRQQEVLLGMGCQLGQGFGLHRPMSADALTALLTDQPPRPVLVPDARTAPGSTPARRR